MTDRHERHDEHSPLLAHGDHAGPSAATRANIKVRRRNLATWVPILVTLLFILGAGIFVIPSYLAGLARLVEYEIVGVSGVYPALDGVHGTIQAHYRVDADRSWLLRRVLARAPLQLTEVQADVLWPEDREVKVAKLVADPFQLSPAGKHYAQDLEIVGVGHVLDTVKAAKLSHALWTGSGPDAVPLRVEARIAGLLPFTFKVRALVDVHVARQLQMPQPSARLISVREHPTGGLSVEAQISCVSPVSATLDLPKVALQVLVDSCGDGKPQLTSLIDVDLEATAVHCRKGQRCSVTAIGRAGQLSAQAQRACSSGRSALDVLSQAVLSDASPRVYIRGAATQADLPRWAAELLHELTLPVQLPARGVRPPGVHNLTVSDVAFTVQGGSDSDDLGVAAAIIAAAVPLGWRNVFKPIHVSVGGTFEALHHAKTLGQATIPAAMVKLTPGEAGVDVNTAIEDAQLTVVDYEALATSLRDVMTGNTTLRLAGHANIVADTPLGHVRLNHLPVPRLAVQIPRSGLPDQIPAKVKEIVVLSSTEDLLVMAVRATIGSPYPVSVDLSERIEAKVEMDGTHVGQLSVSELHLRKVMSPVEVHISFNRSSGAQKLAGARMLSQYLSGNETLVTLAAFNQSMPSRPRLAAALAKVPIQLMLPLPQLDLPTGDEDDEPDEGAGPSRRSHKTGSPFLVKASFHFFSSTASFVLRNPLNESVLIDSLSAVALYHGSPVGTLEFDASLIGAEPIVLAGDTPTSETPRLPVRWSARGLGRDALRAALGGTLRLNATAKATVRVGRFGPIDLDITADDVGAGVGF